MSKVAVMIPARMGSTRFPGKPLALIGGEPMILHVARRCAQAVGQESVYVATDSDRIKQVVDSEGFNCLMTGQCFTGTDRVAQAAREIDAEFFINVQGDEPLIEPEVILYINDAVVKNRGFVWNAMAKLREDQDPEDVTIPKVVVDEEGSLLNMSRKAICSEYHQDYRRQVCVYGYNKEDLYLFHEYGKRGKLEEKEDIEILRFLELGVPVKMLEVDTESIAVDLPEHIRSVEAALMSKKR